MIPVHLVSAFSSDRRCWSLSIFCSIRSSKKLSHSTLDREFEDGLFRERAMLYDYLVSRIGLIRKTLSSAKTSIGVEVGFVLDFLKHSIEKTIDISVLSKGCSNCCLDTLFESAFKF